MRLSQAYVGLNDEESLFGDTSQLSCFLLFLLQVCWELTKVRGEDLLLLVVVVWWWWQQEPGLRARESQKPQVRLGSLKQMDSGQHGLPLWARPLLPLDLVAGREQNTRVLGLGVGPGCPEWVAVRLAWNGLLA